MLTINVIRDDETQVITGTINGEKFNVIYVEDLYKNLLVKKEELNTVITMDQYDVWVKEVKEMLDSKTLDIITTACPELVKSAKGYYHLKDVKSGKVSKKAIPQPIVDVILESVEKGIEATPIVKAWTRFLRNPNFSSSKAENFAAYITATIVDREEMTRLIEEEGYVPEKAELLATYNDVAISQEGLIVGKKYARLLTKGWSIDKETNKAIKKKLYDTEDDTVDMHTGDRTEGKMKDTVFNEDLYFEPPVMGTGGDAFTSGSDLGHVIRIGAKHTLPKWEMVNTSDNNSCVKGLHIGGWQYVQSYKSLNCQLLECFVDPAEIGAICDIGWGDGAMRVREYFIYGATEGRNKGIYHSSHYAAMKDTEWTDYMKEAINKSNDLMAELQDDTDNLGF